MGIPHIFDRRTYAMRRARAGASFLAGEVAETLAFRLSTVKRRFGLALDLGSRREVFTKLAPHADKWIRSSLHPDEPADVAVDDELLPFASGSFDLIVSALSLHATNDLPGALAQIRTALKPDSLFLAALFGGDTLHELRTAFAEGESEVLGGASPRVSPFADVRDLGALLQRAGFALPVADSEKTVVRYGAFGTLVRDLRALGETNALEARTQSLLRRDVLASVIASYAARNSDADGRLSATFEVIYLTGWAPHESQPQPLRPGSAKSRLADALGAVEQSAGEPTSPHTA